MNGTGAKDWQVALAYWGVVFLWLLLISTLSTDPFSARNTHRYIDPILRWLFPNLTPAGFVTAHTLIRKCAHFIEFFILGLLVFWACRRGREPIWHWRWAAWAVVFSSFWGLVDELHQSLVSSRTASLADSAIDALGGITSQVFLWAVRRRRLRAQKNSVSASQRQVPFT